LNIRDFKLFFFKGGPRLNSRELGFSLFDVCDKKIKHETNPPLAEKAPYLAGTNPPLAGTTPSER